MCSRERVPVQEDMESESTTPAQEIETRYGRCAGRLVELREGSVVSSPAGSEQGRPEVNTGLCQALALVVGLILSDSSAATGKIEGLVIY